VNIGEACGLDGRCHPYRHVGESCTELNDQCDRGTACDSVQGRCVGLAAEGEGCFVLYNGPFCASGLYCDGSDRDRPVCRRWRADGEACTSDSPCQSRYCDRATDRCAPLPTCE
jgi:hypothetical protein